MAYAAAMPVEHVSHLGLCVADLDRAARFYREGLGFRERSRIEVAGETSSRLLGLEGAALRGLYLERDGLRLELLQFDAPGPRTLETPRPMNGLGLTHLSLRVSDLDTLTPALVAAGGRVLEESRIEAGPVKALFLLDPDGTRLELLEAPGDPSRLPGEPVPASE